MKRRHSQKRIKAAIFSTIAIASLGVLAGCELLVDFDRTLIDGGALGQIDGAFDGSEQFDSSTDAPTTTDASDASDATAPVDAGDSGSPQDSGEDAADADAG